MKLLNFSYNDKMPRDVLQCIRKDIDKSKNKGVITFRFIIITMLICEN